jgi:hypothetical protein
VRLRGEEERLTWNGFSFQVVTPHGTGVACPVGVIRAEG